MAPPTHASGGGSCWSVIHGSFESAISTACCRMEYRFCGCDGHGQAAPEREPTFNIRSRNGRHGCHDKTC